MAYVITSRNRTPYKRRYRKRTLTGTKTKRQPMRTSKRRVPQFAIAQINPFSEKAVGVRVPDSNTCPSTGFFSLDQYSLTTSSVAIQTSWAVGAVLVPNAYTYAVGANPSSTSAVTWPTVGTSGTTLSKQAAIDADYDLVRIVAHGVRLSSAQPATSASGFVHICYFPINTFNLAGGAYPFPTNAAQMENMPGYKRVSLSSLIANPLTYVNKYGSSDAFQYFSPNDNFSTTASGTFYQQHSWNGICVLVTGNTGITAVSTELVNIEAICHFEGQVGFASASVNTNKTAERPNAAVMDATAGYVAAKDPMYQGANDNIDPNGWFNSLMDLAQDNSNIIGSVSDYVLPGSGQFVVGAIGGNKKRKFTNGSINSGIPGITSGMPSLQ